METSPYRVSEMFLSFQGEGEYSGKAAFFVRLFGCNVRCPWCDTDYAWKAEGKSTFLSAYEIACAAAKSGASIAVITGGEPCLQNLKPLVRALKEKGIRAHLETSGVCKIDEEASLCSFDWVALSPKLFREPLKESLERADEIKAIVSSKEELFEYKDKFFGLAKNAKSIWITPEWSKSSEASLLKDIADFAISSKDPRVRAGWQLHKNYFVR